MTVIELNAQLLRELSYLSDNEGYLQKTLDFIKKLTKSNVASNVRGQIYTEMLERLSDFQEYEKGWDGDGPCSRKAVTVSWRDGRSSILQMELSFYRTKKGNLVSI